MSAPATGGVLGLLRRFFGNAVSQAAGYAIGGAVTPTLEPLTRDLANETWQAHPVYPLSAGVVAELLARDRLPLGEAEAEAARTGYSTTRLALLAALAQTLPTLDELLRLRNRDVITEGELDDVLRLAGYAPVWASRVKALRRALPTLSDMVRFAVREVYDPAARAELDLDAELPAAFVEDAGRVGLSAERAAQEWAAHWTLPSFEQGVEMFHRGEISQAQLDVLLKALDYAPVWRPRLRAIVERIPPLSDMIRFAVREAYDPTSVSRLGLDDDFPEEFAREAALHGMTAERARLYWRAHWRLPSALQGYRMLWRGRIDEAELDALLKALDYPPTWRAHLAAIARVVPGRVDLKRLLKHGIRTVEEVEAGYRRLGYSVEDAADMAAIAEAELGAGSAGDSYLAKARSSLFSRAHREYVSRQLTREEALAALALAAVPQAQRGGVVDLWTEEAELIRTELTQAQIVKAHKKGIYDDATALAELQERGLSETDARTRLDIG